VEEIRREIEATIFSVIKAHTKGYIGERGLVNVLLQLEEEKVAPYGFVLTASNTLDDWTVVMLRRKGSSEPCAAVEFLPDTGEFREVGAPCRAA
jgi:hypothetical protein